MIVIEALPAFTDNYFWLLHDQNQATVVDPGDAQIVLDACQKRNLSLTNILITHRHSDHTGGVDHLQKSCTVTTYAPKNAGVNADTYTGAGDTLVIFGTEFFVLGTPGHTSEHVSYHAPALEALFCGDTLFASGCGRLFDGSAQELMDSIATIGALPESTKIYPAHEYSLENVRFALQQEPHNAQLKIRQKHFTQVRANNQPTLPTTLQQEWQTNPFLRCQKKELLTHFVSPLCHKDSLDAFAYLRMQKDNF